MPGPWDDSLRIFISENPQDFASWIIQTTGVKVKEKLLTRFETRVLEADALLLLVTEEEVEFLLEIEFQSTNDPDIGERLLAYSFEAKREHHLPVQACVIWLRSDGEVPEPPLKWPLPGGRINLVFDYVSIELAEMPTNEFRQLNLPGILPLMILTKQGATHDVVQEVITRLEATGKRSLLLITEFFSSLVFTNEDDQKWLERTFAVIKDQLRDTPAYQRYLKEGLEKGREELRQAVVDVVQERFPELVAFARKQVDTIEDFALLRRLNIKMSTAQTIEEAAQALIAIGNGEKKN